VVSIWAFDRTTRRSDPNGLTVRFEVDSTDPIVRIEIDLDGDGEPAIPLTFPIGIGFDGRYVRGLAVKPTVNGTWPLVVSAIDARGRSGRIRCAPGITVTF